LLREWRATEKILRRHRRDSGLTVSIEWGWRGTGYAIFIIRRIGKPEDYVVQIRTDPGDVVKGESLIDDGIHADMPYAVRIRGKVPDILNRAEGRHRHFGQEERKGRIAPQAVGPQLQGIHTANLFLRKNGNSRASGRQAAIGSEAGTRLKPNGSAWAATGLKMSVKPRVAIARGWEGKRPGKATGQLIFLSVELSLFLFSFLLLRLDVEPALTAIQFCAELGNVLTRRFEQRSHFGWLGVQLDLEIALSGASAKVKPHDRLLNTAEDALKRRVT